MIKKILIANRGEIAVRIIKASRELSIPSVAVYSTIDRSSLHVQEADEAICIGPPEPLKSYLNMDTIIDAARKAGADAIHPGYGFLAENPTFARRCKEKGIIFIGPNAKVMQSVGDKIIARQTMKKEGISIIPGMMNKSSDIKELKKSAEQIGYPVLIKASGGGGGKGMRIISSEKELETAVESSMREAKFAFGDESIYFEKYIENPRHIEFQIACDHFGNTVHIFERECSIQRRYQKIVEETPSTALDEKSRTRMGETAVKVAKASGYDNIGTVEFILDQNGSFYFLEVNARVQVEHPVTELVTGVDLVKEQIKIAQGEKLSLKQENLEQKGHSIECRIYAEDPENNFLPSPGHILFLKEPSGPGIRVDSGIYSGCEVSPYYDPILSKVIVWGETRESARRKMVLALRQYVILGIKTPIQFLIDVLEHPEFIKGNLSTNFIKCHLPQWKEQSKKYITEAAIAVALNMYNKSFAKRVPTKAGIPTPWQTVGNWSI